MLETEEQEAGVAMEEGGLTTIQESEEISDASQQDRRKYEEEESENSQNSQSQSDLTGSQQQVIKMLITELVPSNM
jgi:hypothetical protein